MKKILLIVFSILFGANFAHAQVNIACPYANGTTAGCLPALGGDTTKFLSGDGTMRAPSGAAAAHGFQIFYASGTFNAPVTGSYLVRAVGGGSGGGGGSKGGGKGGGSGSDVSAVYSLTAGDVVTVTVGLKGAAGTGVTSGWGNMSVSGGNTYFGGVAAAGGPQVHGGTPTVDAGTGATPGGTGMGQGGGPGADANCTNGGAAGGFGGGGGGGGGCPSGKGGDGGAARDGIVIVSW
jgi:hypothetical protein